MESSSKISLDVLSVNEPCTENWNAMQGDARVRFCGLCKRNVFNLSAMAREEAERVVSEAEGRVCVRFYRRADGTVTTSDCAPDRLAIARRKAKKALTWAAVLVAGFLAAISGIGFAALFGYHELMLDHTEDPCDMPMMGAVAPLEMPPEPLPEDPTTVEPTTVEPAPESETDPEGT